MPQKDYTPKEYQHAIELLNMGLGITTVSRKLNIPKSTLHYWKHKTHKPPQTRWQPKPTKELAYVIGVLLGDGHVRKKRNYLYIIELETKDEDFAEEFSRAIAKVLNKKLKKPKIKHRKTRSNLYRICYYSKAFYTWYKNQTLKTLKEYIEYNKECVKMFLRGIYDSEGSNCGCARISLYNSDLELLKYVQYLLRKYFNIEATKVHLAVKAGTKSTKKNGEVIITKKNCYEIAIYKKLHIQKFLREIGFSIARKQLGLPRK